MVIKIADDSYSDSTNGDNEDEDEDEPILVDCAWIFWMNLSESIDKINELEVIDRAFFHGDIVATTSDP